MELFFPFSDPQYKEMDDDIHDCSYDNHKYFTVYTAALGQINLQPGI